jgi:MFS family permease
MLSGEFIRLTWFFVICSFFANFYIGSFDVALGDMDYLSVDEQHYYGKLFTIVITCGIVLIPLIGTIMDKYGFPLAAMFTTSTGVIWSILLLTQSKVTLFLSFLFYCMFRTSLYTFVFAYLADTLGFKYFGVLGGVMFVFGGVLNFLQVPISNLASGTCHLHLTMTEITHLTKQETITNTTDAPCTNGYWLELNCVMGVLIASTYYFAYEDWKQRQQKREATENLRRHTLSSSRPLNDSYGTI